MRKMSKIKVRAGTGCNRRLSFSIDGYEKPAFFFAFENYQTRSYETCCSKSKTQKQVHKDSLSSSSSSSSSYRFVIKRARCSVARLFQRIRTSVSTVQHSIPRQRTKSQQTSAALTKGGPFVGMAQQSRSARFGDCHQAEAIEDCIKFLKNSSCKEDFLKTTSVCQLQHLLHIQRP